MPGSFVTTLLQGDRNLLEPRRWRTASYWRRSATMDVVQDYSTKAQLNQPWPSSIMIGGGRGLDPAIDANVLGQVRWDERQWHSSHGHAPYRIAGTVTDSASVAIGDAKLRLYQTKGQGPGRDAGADGERDAVIAETTSAPSGDALTTGSYGFPVLDNTTQYYIVGENSDGTLVGTTVKTLTGS